MGKLRMYPFHFINVLKEQRQYYKQSDPYIFSHPGREEIRTAEGVKGLDEATKYFSQLDPLPPLFLSYELSKIARKHAIYIGEKGLFGPHNTDKENGLKERILQTQIAIRNEPRF